MHGYDRAANAARVKADREKRAKDPDRRAAKADRERAAETLREARREAAAMLAEAKTKHANALRFLGSATADAEAIRAQARADADRIRAEATAAAREALRYAAQQPKDGMRLPAAMMGAAVVYWHPEHKAMIDRAAQRLGTTPAAFIAETTMRAARTFGAYGQSSQARAAERKTGRPKGRPRKGAAK